ncbi:TetR/AcrR family transcriptional regulator [Leifsonia sp. Root227]|uniref:TetR/AcrR family transcriptional regulator n=1 Tax=Leifsonia sp. Root227 TaxID=1736496 RepID=UPI0009E79720|nr:TetR/AcrR family transcriptional regulator [Leifsonia sp. Root227]
MASPVPANRRREQRRETDRRILAEARRLFSERGYESTTVRDIAAAARTDPALVVRNFGSKADLYERAVGLEPELDDTADLRVLASNLVASLEEKLTSPPVELLAALRSVHSDRGSASDLVSVMRAQQAAVAEKLTAPHPRTRAGLVGALTIGVVVSRYILELDGLGPEHTDAVAELLRPVIAELIDPAEGEPSLD